MFHRLAKRKMSAEEMGSARERELRLTVAQLREQLEEEKRARKRDHSDKVSERIERSYTSTFSYIATT